jgi:hypothetical protein
MSPATWISEQTHAAGCAACDEASRKAITIATATGSRSASYTEAGNCGARVTRKCEWYALCDQSAAGTTPHPILGAVPICESCAAKHGLTISKEEQ